MELTVKPPFDTPPRIEAASVMLGQIVQVQTMLREAAYGGLVMPETVIVVNGVTVSLLIPDHDDLCEWATFLDAPMPVPQATSKRRWATCGEAFGLHVQIVGE